MRGKCEETSKDTFESWLVGELLLVALLGSATALFLDEPGPAAHLRAAGGPARARHRRRARGDDRRDPRRRPLLGRGAARSTCCSRPASSPPASGTLAFSVVPVLGGVEQGAPEAWAAIGSRVLAATLIALAPLVPGAAVARAAARALVTGSRRCCSRRSLAIWLPCTASARGSARSSRGRRSLTSSSPSRRPSSRSSPSSP